jgi:hypothetical protein
VSLHKTNPRAASVSIDVVTAAGSPIGIGRASYQSDVTFTGESAFTGEPEIAETALAVEV